MISDVKIAVASRSFSKNSLLRQELESKFAKVTFNESGKILHGDELIQFLSGHERVITALEKIDESILSQLPELKVISKYGVGLDSLDYDALLKFDIKLGWTKGVNKRSVAELALCFILIMIRNVFAAQKVIEKGSWNQVTGMQLTGKKVGIIGCGFVGKELLKLLSPFECELFYYDLYCPDAGFALNAQYISLHSLLSTCDVISLHIPYTNKNHLFLNSERLSLMKQNAILINTARGNIVDEAFLKFLLENNKIAGAAFDVFGVEPPQDNDLINLPNFFCTPHIGGSSQEAILAMGRAAIEGLEKYQPVYSFQKFWE